MRRESLGGEGAERGAVSLGLEMKEAGREWLLHRVRLSAEHKSMRD